MGGKNAWGGGRMRREKASGRERKREGKNAEARKQRGKKGGVERRAGPRQRGGEKKEKRNKKREI